MRDIKRRKKACTCYNGNMALNWTSHPALPTLSPADMQTMSAEKILNYFNRREAAIAAERESPYEQV